MARTQKMMMDAFIIIIIIIIISSSKLPRDRKSYSFFFLHLISIWRDTQHGPGYPQNIMFCCR